MAHCAPPSPPPTPPPPEFPLCASLSTSFPCARRVGRGIWRRRVADIHAAQDRMNGSGRQQAQCLLVVYLLLQCHPVINSVPFCLLAFSVSSSYQFSAVLSSCCLSVIQLSIQCRFVYLLSQCHPVINSVPFCNRCLSLSCKCNLQ